MAVESIGQATYETWLPLPFVADQAFRTIGDESWHDTVSRRLFLGALNASAEMAVWHEGIAKRVERFVRLAPTLWKTIALPKNDPLWASGDTTAFLDGAGSGMQINASSNDRVELIGVRFDPDDVSRLLPSVPRAAQIENEPGDKAGHGSVSRRQDMPQLPESIAQAWASWFKTAYPDGSQDAAVVSAHGMFPNHNFSRDRVRGLIGPKPPGRPPKSDS